MSNSSSTLLTKCTQSILAAPNLAVFSYLDLLDSVFCVVFKYLDEFFEGKASQCYCISKKSEINNVCHDHVHHHHHHHHHHGHGDDDMGMSETLLGRKKKLKQFISLLEYVEKLLSKQKKNGGVEAGFRFRNQKKAVIHRLGHRWSDCLCESCIAWTKADDHKLHVVTEETSNSPVVSKGKGNPTENVVFIHGILSSSSFWTQSVFPKLCDSSPNRNNNNDMYNLYAVDLLGHGRSPKPRDSLYTVKEHVEWIEKSVISPFELNSFHLVAHSMGCILALALAAKHTKSVKSITLVAPPYFPSEDGVEFKVMNCLTPKTLWPPEAFLSSVMTWYEHVSRSLCFLYCRNHRFWEGLVKRLTGLRDLSFIQLDLTRHTHHSGWHTTHNVLYRGVKQMDKNLEILRKAGTKIHVVVGTRDRSIPPECSNNIRNKFPDIEVTNIPNTGHRSVVFKRKREFAQFLLRIWENAKADNNNKCHMNGSI